MHARAKAQVLSSTAARGKDKKFLPFALWLQKYCLQQQSPNHNPIAGGQAKKPKARRKDKEKRVRDREFRRETDLIVQKFVQREKRRGNLQ